MDEDALRELLTSTDGVDMSPTAEMMMMNSDMPDDVDGIDPELLAALQQQQQQMAAAVEAQLMRSNPSVITTTAMNDIDEEEEEEEDEELEDETIVERIVALKDMFPEPLQNAVGTLNRTLVNTSKLAYSKGRSAAWWVTSTLCVLVFPILIQKELLQVAEQMTREQRSILLGPQAATGGFSGGVL